MFTGIVEELGHGRVAATGRSCASRADDRARRTSRIGDSIAVNGCCLTVVASGRRAGGRPTSPTRPSPAPTSARSPPATRSTSSGRSAWRTASAATSCRATSTPSARSSTRRPTCGSACPHELLRYVVEKGSITVDGVSLTVVEPLDDGFTVAHHPAHRRGHHARARAGPGDRVNLEVDVMAKYVERLLAAHLDGADDAPAERDPGGPT